MSKPPRYWNYRVIITNRDSVDSCAIHEVYYDDDAPTSWTGPVILMGDNLKEMRDVFAQASKAIEKPALREALSPDGLDILIPACA
jgi:hypothetical protein